VQLREQHLGLSAKMIEIRAGRKFLVHGSSMRDLRSAIRRTKDVRSGGRTKGELNSSRGPGGALRAEGTLYTRAP